MDIYKLLLPEESTMEESRRKKLLLFLTFASGIFTLICLFIYLGIALFKGFTENMEKHFFILFICTAGLLIAIPLILLLIKKFNSRVSGIVFLLILTIVIALFNASENLLSGYGLFWFAVPIVFSSFVLHPFSSFLSAGLNSAILLFFTLRTGDTPNGMAMAAFFIIALISALSVKSMENTVKKFEDITSKLNEKLSQQNKSHEKVLKDNKIKGVFINNISHDVRTPMSAILGISKFLSEHHSENLTEDQKEGLQMIYQSCKKLLLLVNEVLELSQIDVGKIDVFFNHFSVQELIGELKTNINQLIDSKDIIVYFQVDSDIPESICTDRKKIYQILFNTISNLIKYSENGEILVHVYKNNGYLYFEIKSNTLILSDEQIKFIFQSHIEPEQMEIDAGIGFNLTLSKKITDMINGNMEIESLRPKGTIIRIYLPYTSEETP